MKINLSSLAPDSFILGPPELLEQFYPKKVFNIPCIKKLLDKPQTDHKNKVVDYVSTPWGVEIHLTSNCQLCCLRCSYGQRNKNRAELNPELLNKLLTSINKLNVRSVIFSGGGDPLLWKSGKYEDILKSNVTYSQAIATNGLGIIENFNKDLLNRLNIVQINANGYDRHSYLKVTRQDKFNKFVENIQWLLKTRIKNITQVTAKIVIDSSNYKMVKKYLEFCYQMGFDLVVVKLAGNFELGQDVAINQKQKQELRELIYASQIINKYPERIDAIATEDNSTELELSEKCWVVEYGLYILIRSNGDVFPCIASSYTSENSIGNLYEQELEEIWESDRHCAVKNKLHEDMRSYRCNLSVCRHVRYNFLLDETARSSKYVKSLPIITKDEPKLL